ncbi:hypothetical protein [Paraburkholderia sediminicola]|uniref:hypothetical protein n=1 Tax=Paraburkholderia sediminicola TaxID=458836 RepID=UPI0038B83416
MQIPTWVAMMGAGITLVAGVVGNLSKIVSGVSQAFKWCQACLTGKDRQSGLPRKTVVAIPQPRFNALWWSMGKMGDKPMLQIIGDFNVTNIWTDDVRLLGATIQYRRWGFLPHTERGDVNVQQQRGVYHGHYAISPNQTTSARVSFHFVPVHAFKKRFTADLALVDQFGNEHWLHGLTFKHIDSMP